MKKLLLLLLLLLILTLSAACTPHDGTTVADSTDAPPVSAETSREDTETDTDASDTPVISTTPTVTVKIPETTAPETTDNGLLKLPDTYYLFPDSVINCAKIVIPAEYNPGLRYDIYPVIQKDTVYFLLPSSVDLRQVVYHQLDNKNNLRAGRFADFTNDSPRGKTVAIFSEEYRIVAIRSDSPTLYLEIDERYGTLDEVKADNTKETRAYGTFVLDCREDVALKYGWQTHYESLENDPDSPCTAYIKGRGNWTWNSTDKKGYSIKFEKKADLLGMGKSKKWALIGNVPDNSMLRNTLAYYLGAEVGLDYSPVGEIVDFFVNGEYQGAFLLAEKIDIEEERVDIADLEGAIKDLDPSESHGSMKFARITGASSRSRVTLKYWTNVENPEDITGGYIVEMEMSDRYQNEPSGFVTSKGTYYVIKSPEYASYEQVEYIATLFENMEQALYSKDGIHPKTGLPYTDYIDLDSLVRKYWIEEISKNHDGAKTSQYFYKPADSQSMKIHAGPVWDYDIAFGISSETVDPKGWFMRTEKAFFKACWQHEDFIESAKTVFAEEFIPAINKFVDTLADEEADKIYQSTLMNNIVWPQYKDNYYRYVEDLKTYVDARMKWIYSELFRST